jgi:hypothetical protein
MLPVLQTRNANVDLDMTAEQLVHAGAAWSKNPTAHRAAWTSQGLGSTAHCIVIAGATVNVVVISSL